MKNLRKLVVVACVLAVSACAMPVQQTTFPSQYRAAGNEPFWNVTITGQQAVIERPDIPRTERAISTATRLENGWRLNGSNLLVTIDNKRCENDMSGAPFEHTVTLELDGRSYKGCGGKKLAPERIEMTQWTAVEIGARTLAAEGRPFLAIDEQGRSSGSDGCNRMSGGFALLADGTVQHAAAGWIATRMACPEPQMKLAADYGNALKASTQWRFEGASLLLLDKNGATAVRFQRTY